MWIAEKNARNVNILVFTKRFSMFYNPIKPVYLQYVDQNLYILIVIPFLRIFALKYDSQQKRRRGLSI